MALDWHKTGASAADGKALRFAPGGGALLVAAAMAAGAGAYLEAPGEPPRAWGWGLLALSGVAAWGAHAYGRAGAAGLWRRIATLAAAFAALGFALAQARAHALTSPPMDRPAGVTLTGWVERIDPPSGPRARAGSPQRYVVRVAAVEAAGEPAHALTGRRVRVSAPAGAARLGARVRVRARVWPPPAPPTPGAYDAQRRLYFDGIAALGRAASMTPAADLRTPRGERAQRAIAAARGVVAARLQAPGEAGAIVAALVTGHRGDIVPEHAETLRAAGLGHILAISGLHMALAAGGAYWALSFAFASITPLARRGDPRRWAAGAALVVATAYLVFSGAAVSTQRAYVMAAAVFAALVLRRRALSLRTLAAAGVVVLTLRPESAVSAGFHMSFAATAALIAAYAAAERRWARRDAGVSETAAEAPWRKRARRVVTGAIMTSVVAGAVTGPIAALHFNRASWVAIPVNIVVMPVFSLWVMPMAAAAGVATPLGAEGPPAAAAAAGIGVMLAVAEWATPQTPPAVAAGAPAALVFGLAAVAAACAFTVGRWRVAAPLAAAAAAVWLSSPRPVAWLGADGALVVMAGGNAFAAPPYRGDYARGVVMRRAGVAPEQAQPLTALATCDALGCVVSGRGFGGLGRPWRLAAPLRPEALAHDCRRADWVVVSAGVAEVASPGVLAACAPARLLRPDGRGDVTLYAAPWGVWRRDVAGGVRPWRRRRDGELRP